jgi:hypothetical protein
MFGNRSIPIVLLSLVAVAACKDDTVISPTGTATARVANATSIPVDVATSTPILTTSLNVGFAGTSSCLTTDVFEPSITVGPAGTSTTYAAFAPSIHADQRYVIVDYPNFNDLPTFATINTTVLPPIGQAGLRVFNGMAKSSPFDVYVTTVPNPTSPLGTAVALGVGFKMVSGLIPVTPGTPLTVALTFAGTQTIAALAQNLTFTANQNFVLVIAPPPAVGTPGPVTLPRTFLVPAC